MKLSMWIVADWLEKYAPVCNINRGEQTINGVRYLEDDIELSKEYLYIRYAEPYSDSKSNQIICVNHTDFITLSAPDIYVIFNEIQQMLEFYNNWETTVLQAINADRPLNEILSLTVPILKRGVAMTDLSHKILGDAHYSDTSELQELSGGFLTIEELQIINEQLRENVKRRDPYLVQSKKALDIIRNFYSNDGKLLGWFVSLNGGTEDQLHSRLQLCESFCALMDFWCRIHLDGVHDSNLFLEILEKKETEPEAIRIRMEGIGFSNGPRMQLIILESCSADLIGITVAQRYITNSFQDISSFLYQDRGILIINLEAVEAERFFSYLSQIAAMQKIRCGCSYPFTDPLNIRDAYIQAETALDYGSKDPGTMNDCKDYALDYMRSRFKAALEIGMTSPVLADLIAYDKKNGTDYYQTLKTYLLCERDQTLTARTLCIHRNSLVYRVNKLKEMIDIDLDQERNRLYLLLSFFVTDETSHSL